MIKVTFKTNGEFWFKDNAGRQLKSLPIKFKDKKAFQTWLWDNTENVVVWYCGTLEDDQVDFTSWGNRFSTVMTLLTKTANRLNKESTYSVFEGSMAIQWQDMGKNKKAKQLTK